MPDAAAGALHPRIDELLEVLDETRASLTMAVAQVPAERRDVRPAPGKWSVGEILDHVRQVDANFARLFSKRVDEARAAGAPAETDGSSILSRLDRAMVVDRSRKVEAPSRIQPREGTLVEDALAALRESRAAVRAALAAASGLALGSVVHPHPVFGALDMYQWTLFIAYHEERHAQQIREIARGGDG
ncbi:MAG TPA: DinB family protein [Gemmatimonadaceae bacterium]|nr:DinB family protein [Gemmatimonadaceae bacterium]